jgi:hypothetical protein
MGDGECQALDDTVSTVMGMQWPRRPMASLPLLTGLLIGLLAVALALGCAREGGAAASSSAQSTPDAAVASYVEAAGDRYAGPCEQTRSPEDIGKICSKLIEQRGSTQAHLIGLTFSEYTTWLFVAPQDGGWSVIATEPLDFHDMTGSIPWPR